MRYEPTLIVNRLVVQRSGRAVYDERFHLGVNVIPILTMSDRLLPNRGGRWT